MLEKLAGVLDSPHEHLPQDVWQTDKQLLPNIRDQILSLAYSFIPKEDIYEVFILGSITGYKYTEASDIDVNIKVLKNPKQYHLAQSQNNGILAEGTRHPINFFVTEIPPTKKTTYESWKDYKFGVYDVLGNNWLKAPPERSTIRDPKRQFRQEILVAKRLADNFVREVEDFREDILDYETLSKLRPQTAELKQKVLSKQREIERDLVDLIAQAKQVKKDRKFVYKWGFGIPRHSFKNIVYKMIEHGQYGKLFEKLKSMKDDEI